MALYTHGLTRSSSLDLALQEIARAEAQQRQQEGTPPLYDDAITMPPAPRGQDELNRALEVSLAFHEREAAERDELARVIEASKTDPIPPEPSAGNRTDAEIDIPSNFNTRTTLNFDEQNPYLWFLMRDLGVKIRLVRGDTALRIEALTPEARLVAEHRLREVLADPAIFEAQVQLQKNEKVHIFVDHSNISMGGQSVPNGTAFTRDLKTRVSAKRIHNFVLYERTACQQVCFGSVAPGRPTQHATFAYWRAQGYKTHVAERSSSGKEQFVDHGLIAEMLHSVINHQGEGRTLILVSGDGNDNGDANGPSFHTVVRQAIRSGWKVEVWSWRANCSRRYRQLASEMADNPHFSLNYLDNYRDELVNWQPYKSNQPEKKPALLDGAGGGGGAAAEEPAVEELDPDWMNCPISFEPMQDPVRLPTAPTVHYQRENLVEWLQDHHTCPYTNEPAEPQDVQDSDQSFVERLQAWLNPNPNTSFPRQGNLAAAAADADPPAVAKAMPVRNGNRNQWAPRSFYRQVDALLAAEGDVALAQFGARFHAFTGSDIRVRKDLGEKLKDVMAKADAAGACRIVVKKGHPFVQRNIRQTCHKRGQCMHMHYGRCKYHHPRADIDEAIARGFRNAGCTDEAPR